jgi:hypothetical protein
MSDAESVKRRRKLTQAACKETAGDGETDPEAGADGNGLSMLIRACAEIWRSCWNLLQANRKTIEGASHPDRNAQFEYSNRKVKEHLRTRDPVISVDTKKKELVGTSRMPAG